MIRMDWALTGLVVLATFSVIFLVGVAASTVGLVPWVQSASGPSSPGAPQEPGLPPSDVPGQNLPDVDRYPDSVRTKYERYRLGEAQIIEVGYLSDATLEEVSDFYGELASSGGWRNVGSDVSAGEELGLLMSQGEGADERRVFVEIEPEGELVSVEVEEVVNNR